MRLLRSLLPHLSKKRILELMDDEMAIPEGGVDRRTFELFMESIDAWMSQQKAVSDEASADSRSTPPAPLKYCSRSTFRRGSLLGLLPGVADLRDGNGRVLP
eukprot:5842853-Prymnesium_polylepis.2